MHRRHLILAIFALFIGATTAPLQAESTMFYSGGKGAINGYDTVAYFITGKPVKGRADISVQWKGAIWRFSNHANRETFEANPWAYAPQYGGYCAYGVAQGVREETAPDAWQIVNGKLYLIHTPEVKLVWIRDIDGHIIRANRNWPGVLSH